MRGEITLNDIESFLLNPEENDKVFKGNYHPRKIHKEKYDDRFIIIYMKTDKENYLEQNDYEVAGYLDIKEKCIYNHSYNMDEFLPKEKGLLERSSFGFLNNKMHEELLIYRDKIDYLNQIILNENHKFDDLYINKSIYQSIKDLDAKTVNITIQYGENSHTFKYDYNTLRRDLLNDDKGSNAWGVAYEKVSDFIKANTNKEDSRTTEEFLFTHVTSITYGKKEVYHHDLDTSINHDIEEDVEMELDIC